MKSEEKLSKFNTIVLNFLKELESFILAFSECINKFTREERLLFNGLYTRIELMKNVCYVLAFEK